MPSTNRTTMLTRTSQRLAAAALMVLPGLAFCAAPIATAEPGEWDIEAYDNCMAKTIRNQMACCADSGGVITASTNDPFDELSCQAPAAAAVGPTAPSSKPGAPLPRAPVNNSIG